jgi:hypothetical protein
VACHFAEKLKLHGIQKSTDAQVLKIPQPLPGKGPKDVNKQNETMVA